MTAQIEVGTRVRFSRKFLKSTGQFTGPVPFRRGVVTKLTVLGKGGVLPMLAEIAWDANSEESAFTGKALTTALVREDRVHLELF